jgi:hypothetical protein
MGAAPAATDKSVHFLTPKDGATVPAKFKATFAVKGMKVVPAGKDVEDQTAGHFHVLIDEGATPAGVVIPADKTHLHYGKGQKNAELELTPGTHKLTLQFADGLHKSYGPELAQTITVTVK